MKAMKAMKAGRNGRADLYPDAAGAACGSREGADVPPLYWSFPLRLTTTALLLTLLCQWLIPLEGLHAVTGLYHIGPLYPLIAIALAGGVLLLRWPVALLLNGASCLYAVMRLYYREAAPVQWPSRLLGALLSDLEQLLAGRMEVSGELRTLLLFIGAVLLAHTLQSLMWHRLWGPGLALGTGAYLLHLHWAGGIAVERELAITAAVGIVLTACMTYCRAVRFRGSGQLQALPAELRAFWPVRWWIAAAVSAAVLLAAGWGAASGKPRLEEPVGWREGWSTSRLWAQEREAPSGLQQAASPLQQGLDGMASERGRTGYGAYSGTLGQPLTADERVLFIGYSPQPLYWRGEALDDYDGRGWSLSQQHLVRQSLEPAAVRADRQDEPGIRQEQDMSGSVIIQRVELKQPASDWPLLHSGQEGTVLELEAAGSVQSDYAVDADVGTLRPIGAAIRSYTIQSVLPVVVPAASEQRQEAGRSAESLGGLTDGEEQDEIQNTARYLQLPEGLPERVAQLASHIMEEKAGAYDQAKAVEQFLRSSYSYTLQQTSIPGQGQDFVDHFLFEQQQGYCVHFSTAMVIMLRTQGIPARWVKGFTPGERIEPPPTAGGRERWDALQAAGAKSTPSLVAYTVRGSDAHAWVEAYIPGAGWVAFDPTPGYGAAVTDGAMSQPAAAAWPQQLYARLQALWQPQAALLLLCAAVLLGGGSAALWFARRQLALVWALRRYRRAAVGSRAARRRFLAVSAAYWRLLYDRCGIKPAGETAREYIARLALAPEAIDRLEQLVIWEEQQRYGGGGFLPPEHGQVAAVLLPLPSAAVKDGLSVNA